MFAKRFMVVVAILLLTCNVFLSAQPTSNLKGVEAPAPAHNTVTYVNSESGYTTHEATSNHTDPIWIAYDPTNGYMYATSGGASVYYYNSLNNTRMGTIEVAGAQFWGIVYDSYNGNMYATSRTNNEVFEISSSNNTIIKSISCGYFPQAIAYNPANHGIYVSNYYGDSVSVINSINNSVVKTIKTGAPDGMAYDPVSGNMYLEQYTPNGGTEPGYVTVINSTTNEVTDNISVGNYPTGIAYIPANGDIYVANGLSSNISVISPSSNKVIDTINGVYGPVGVTYDPSDGLIYVSATSSIGLMHIINPYQNTVIISFIVGSNSGDYGWNCAYDPTNMEVYMGRETGMTFIPSYYAINFKETGLPYGIMWNVTLEGIKKNSTTNEITFYEPEGTYEFSISNLTAYYDLNNKTLVTMNGNNLTEEVQFMHYAFITGTISPGSAELKINGKDVNVNNGTFNVSVAGGNYNISASSLGYFSFYDKLSVSPGEKKSLNISLNLGLSYIIIGSAVIIFASLAAVVYVKRRRR